MTKEEALRILDTIPTKGDEVDALELAIEALEQKVDVSTNTPTETDCVGRQAAIDAFKERFISENDTIIAITFDGCKKVIENLPSAQPEIIRCRDCKYCTEHYDTDGNVPYWTCSEWDSGTDADGFCHYATKTEVEHERHDIPR